MAGCNKKLSAVGRKGSRDAGVEGVRNIIKSERTLEVEKSGFTILSLYQEDRRVVREGDKVYVIKQYTLEEEDSSTEQPRCLSLVGFIMCTHFIP